MNLRLFGICRYMSHLIRVRFLRYNTRRLSHVAERADSPTPQKRSPRPSGKRWLAMFCDAPHRSAEDPPPCVSARVAGRADMSYMRPTTSGRGHGLSGGAWPGYVRSYNPLGLTPLRRNSQMTEFHLLRENARGVTSWTALKPEKEMEELGCVLGW